MQSDLSLYRRLLAYVRPYLWVFALAAAGLVTVAAGDVMMTYMVLPIVQTLQRPDPIATAHLPLALILIFTLRGLGSFISEYGMAWTGHRVVFDLRKQMIDCFLRLPSSYYDVHPSGRLISQFTFDAYQLADAASSTITTAVRSTLTIAGSVVLLFWLNWELTVIALAAIPVIAIVTRHVGRRLSRSAVDVQHHTGLFTQRLRELVGGRRVVKVFGAEMYERRRAVASADLLRRAMSVLSLTEGANSPLVQFLGACAVAAIVFLMLRQSEAGVFDAASFATYIAALLTLLERLRSLTGINANIQRGLAAGRSIFTLIDTKPEIDVGRIELRSVRGDLVFQNVTARYAGATLDALTDISLRVAPGTSLALVGPSGGGKTTLVNLIPRLYEPVSGCILIDGISIATVRLANLRSHVSLVSQHITLFDDTIAANIAYGGMAGAPFAAIERAAEAAHALEFIRALPQGFYTHVGEGGIRLSGGQRQRLGIARAILKDAPIVLLDEATSALDSGLESEIQAAMDALMKNRTTVVVAHRLSTIERADCIVVLDGGKVVEQGTHVELLRQNGVYARLHRIQFTPTIP